MSDDGHTINIGVPTSIGEPLPKPNHPGPKGWGDLDDAQLAKRMIREADLIEGDEDGAWEADIVTTTLLRAGAERLQNRTPPTPEER